MSNLANVAWQHIYFKPWIGKNYAGQEFKIMNLTESHYIWDIDYCCNIAGANLLCNTILDHVNGHYPVQTYNNAKAVVTGDYKSDNHKFWDRTVMHTYFQDFVGNKNNPQGHRDKSFLKANEDVFIDKARKALFELMHYLGDKQPDLVIVWGNGRGDDSMRKWLPEDYKKVNTCGQNLDLCQYDAFPNTFFWFIKHPAGHFSWRSYHNEYKNVRACLSKYHGKVPFNPRQFI